MLFLKIVHWLRSVTSVQQSAQQIAVRSRHGCDEDAATEPTKDLQDIRLRGGPYQVRVYGGRDPETGRQAILTGSAQYERNAIRLRDRFRAISPATSHPARPARSALC